MGVQDRGQMYTHGCFHVSVICLLWTLDVHGITPSGFPQQASCPRAFHASSMERVSVLLFS